MSLAVAYNFKVMSYFDKIDLLNNLTKIYSMHFSHTWHNARNAEKIFGNVIYNPSTTRAHSYYWFCRFLYKIACLSWLDIEKISTKMSVNGPYYVLAQWCFSRRVTSRKLAICILIYVAYNYNNNIGQIKIIEKTSNNYSQEARGT